MALAAYTGPMFTLIDNLDGTYAASRRCGCGNLTIAIVTRAEVNAYNAGAFVQEAFPSLTADEREAIFISGLCETCWNGLMEDEEDDFDYPDDQYWSGTGELVGDDSYIDYLNRY